MIPLTIRATKEATNKDAWKEWAELNVEKLEKEFNVNQYAKLDSTTQQISVLMDYEPCSPTEIKRAVTHALSYGHATSFSVDTDRDTAFEGYLSIEQFMQSDPDYHMTHFMAQALPPTNTMMTYEDATRQIGAIIYAQSQFFQRTLPFAMKEGTPKGRHTYTNNGNNITLVTSDFMGQGYIPRLEVMLENMSDAERFMEAISHPLDLKHVAFRMQRTGEEPVKGKDTLKPYRR